MSNLQVTWNGATADWNTAADWSSGVVPNDSGTDATLGGTTGYTVTISSAESFAVGSLAITDGGAALRLAGGHLTAAGTVTNAGQLQLQSGATLSLTGDLTNSSGLYINNGGSGGSSLTIGGTLSNSNTVVVGDGSLATTLSAQDLSNTGGLYIEGGSAAQATLDIAAAASATWTGTVNLSGMALLEFGGTAGITTIASGAQINLSGAQAVVAAAGLGTTSDTALTGLTANAGQLQLQSGATLSLTGDLTNSSGLYINNGGSGGSSLTIGGTLSNSNTVVVGDGSLATTLSAQDLSNTGGLYIEGGSAAQATLDIAAAASATWTGTVNLSGMALLEFGGTAGITTIASGAQINLSGAQAVVAAAGLGTTSDTALTGLTANAGQLQLQSGATLSLTGDLTNSSGLYINNGGSGGSSLTIGGTLSNSNTVVVGDGSLATTLSAQDLSNTGGLYIEGGSAAQATLDIAAAASATWTGTVNLSGMALLEFGGTAGITTIASGAQINLSGAQAVVAAAGLGTTSDTALTGLTANAGQLQLQSGATLSLTGDLTNSSGLYINNGGSGGSSLTIGGTLSNSNTVVVGDGSLATTLSAQDLSNTGGLYIEGGSAAQATLDIAAAASATWTGTVNLSGMALLEFGGTAGITTIASGAQINLSGAQAVVAAAGLGTTSDTALTGLTANAGQLQLQSGATLSLTGDLTNSSGLYINNGGSGGSSLTIGGTLSNSNTVVVGDGSLATTLSAQDLSNTGGLYIEGGSAAQATLDIAAAASATWTGTVNLSGMALLEFGGTAGITTIASGAQINLSGAQAVVAAAGLGTTSDTALTGLTANAGQLQLQSGATLSLTGDLTNSSGLYINNGGSGGSSLTIGGTLSNSNTVVVGDGSLATTLSAQDLSNTGGLYIEGGSAAQATLDIAAAASATWTGTVNLSGMALLEFGGTAGITTIASGAQINLSGAQAVVAAAGLGTTSDTALTGLTANAGQLQLQSGATLSLTGDLTNSSGLYINNGGSGGSSLTIGGTLSNSNTVVVGDGSLATTLSAQDLSNTGGLYIEGGSAAQATLDIAGSGTDTGAINLGGDAVLSAGSLTLQGGGTLSVGSGSTATGLIVAAGGSEVVSSGGTSTSPTIAGGTLELASGAVASGPIGFAGSGGTLKIDGTIMPANAIGGFVAGDTLDLTGIGVAASYSYSGGILKLNNSSGTQVAQLNLTTPASSPHFTLGTDGSGGTLVGLSPTNTGTIYSGSHFSGIVLRNPTTQNPTTVAATGYVTNQTAAQNGDAVYGTNAAAWNFTNLGTINAAGAASDGVSLSAGGTVTNAAGGSINGDLYGVAIFATPGTVINLGTIQSNHPTAYLNRPTAIILPKGGVVVNGDATHRGALISGGGYSQGVYTGGYRAAEYANAAATVTNFGTISSARLAAIVEADGGTVANYGTLTGVSGVFFMGGLITNASNGLIQGSGSGQAIYVFGPANASFNGGIFTTVVNAGTIAGSGTAATGILLNEGGTVANTGTILGGAAGIIAYRAASAVSNNGTISTTGTTSGTGVNITAGGSVTNGAARSTTALIQAGGTGINITGGAGTIVNFGTIASTATGTSGDAIFLGAGGTVTNYGLIIGARPPVAVGTGTGHAGVVTTATIGATVKNFGTITSNGTNDSTGINLLHGGVIVNGATNNTSALISGFQNGIYGGGHILSSGGLYSYPGAVGTVVNYGTIQNTNTAASAVRLVSGGSVTNRGLISSPDNGISVGGTTGIVVNFGTIAHSGAGTGGEAVYLGAGGSVTNYGLISGARPGTSSANGYPGAVDTHGQAATVRNFGTIANPNYSNGVNLLAGGTIVNGSTAATAATISGSRGGIYIGGTLGTPTSGAVGLVFNYGTVQNTGSGGAGVDLVSGGSVINDGLIASARTGIAFGNTAGRIANFGTIVSTAALSAASGAGIYLGAGGVITNAAGASIDAVRAAVSLAFFGTTSAAAIVTNSGTLAGNTGVSIGAGDTGNNTIVNFGTIIGTGGIAVALGSGDDRVVIESGSGLGGAIGNFHPGDSFDLPFLSFSGSGTVTLGINNVLQIVENSGTFSINLDPAQSFAGDFFHLTGDGGGGTLVTENPSASAGSKLAFFAGSQAVNLALTTDGSNLPAPVAGDFNIEVFTATAGNLASGYQAAVLVPGAAALDSNEVQSASGSEELLAGSYLTIDRTGGEALQIVGNAAGGSSMTVIGSLGDTIGGSTVAGNAQLIEAIPNGDAVSGPMTIIGGAGATTVWGGANDSIAGGGGAILVDGHPATAGGFGANDTITGGTGAMTVYGAAGDSILGGAGALLVNETQGLAGREQIAGGVGSLTAFDLGRNDTIGGSTGGTTFIDDGYGSGGGSLIAGGSGSAGTLADGENTFIKAAFGDTVSGGADLTLIDATAGGDSVLGGAGTVTGAMAGLSVAVNTLIEGGGGDTITGGVGTGGAGATYIDASAGAQTIAGGSGATTVLAGRGDQIAGGAGALQVVDPNSGGFGSIAGGSGNLTVFDIGPSDTIAGSSAGTTFVNDAYPGAGGFSLITAGNGTVSGATNPAGGAPIGANTWIIGQAGDTILGGSGSMYVDAGSGSESVTGGSSTLAVTIPSLETASGGSAIQGGNRDTITGGSGTLQLYINSDVGAETVNLGAGHGAAALRDVDTGEAGATTSVTGFNTATDIIQSKSAVDAQGVFLGTSQSDGSGGTILTFVDGSTMTLAGIASATAIKFTQ